MHLIPLSLILIATTATATAIPGPEPYYAICIDTDRRNKLDKQAVASCPPGDLGCYCRTPALRDFMEDVKTMACPGKKIDQLAVKAYRVKFNWKCATAFGFEPLVV